MLPVLHPEILKKIIHQACAVDDGTMASKRERQRDLANLTSVSKIFHELCTTELYQDCSTYQPLSFFKQIFQSRTPHGPNQTKQYQLSKVKTLRVGHSPQAVDTPYLDLLDADIAWKGLRSLRYPDDPIRTVQQTLDRLTGDTRYLLEIDEWHRRMMGNGHQSLPNLERVVLLGRSDDLISVRVFGQPKGFADTLIKMPTVKYYCQSSILGPLSLSNTIQKFLHPPKVATFHIANSELFEHWPESLPIIIGATNRYISCCPLKLGTYQSTIPSDIGNHMINGLSASILSMFKRSVVQVQKSRQHPGDQEWKQVPLASVSLDGTTIEMYNMVGDMMMPSPHPVPGRACPEIEKEIKPLNSKVRQALARLVDTQIGPWKGKVSFHNIDEIPLCPACRVPDTTKPALSSVMSLKIRS